MPIDSVATPLPVFAPAAALASPKKGRLPL